MSLAEDRLRNFPPQLRARLGTEKPPKPKGVTTQVVTQPSKKKQD